MCFCPLQYLKESQVERDGQRRNVRSLKTKLSHLGIPMVPSPGHIIPIHVCPFYCLPLLLPVVHCLSLSFSLAVRIAACREELPHTLVPLSLSLPSPPGSTVFDDKVWKFVIVRAAADVLPMTQSRTLNMGHYSYTRKLQVGDAAICKKLSDELLQKHNIYVQSINYPTVPVGSERLRVTPTPVHTEGLQEQFLDSLTSVWKENGLSFLSEPQVASA